MSGVKRLANAVANEPGFMSKIKGFTKQELAEFVQPGSAQMGMKTPKAGKSGKY